MTRFAYLFITFLKFKPNLGLLFCTYLKCVIITILVYYLSREMLLWTQASSRRSPGSRGRRTWCPSWRTSGVPSQSPELSGMPPAPARSSSCSAPKSLHKRVVRGSTITFEDGFHLFLELLENLVVLDGLVFIFGELLAVLLLELLQKSREFAACHDVFNKIYDSTKHINEMTLLLHLLNLLVNEFFWQFCRLLILRILFFHCSFWLALLWST